MRWLTLAGRFADRGCSQTVTEMVASGCHLVVFTTGAGSVVGQAVAPLIKGVPNMKDFNDLETDQPASAFYTNEFLP